MNSPDSVEGGPRRRFRKAAAWLLPATLAFLAWAAAPAIAADKVTIMSALSSGAVNAAIIGNAKGLFAAQGIEVEFQSTDSSNSVIPAVISGTSDIGFTNLTASFYNTARSGDITLIGGATRAKPGYAQVIVIAGKAAYDKGLKSAADLPGKTIGIAGLTGNSYYEFYLLAQKYHFPLSSINFKVLGSDANGVAAVQSGAVDAAAIGGTVMAVPLLQSGGGKTIISTAQESGSLRDAIFTNKQMLANRRDVLVRFMRAYLQSARLYDSVFGNIDTQGNVAHTPEMDGMLAQLSKYIGQPPAGVLVSLPYALPDAAVSQDEVSREYAGWEAIKLADPGTDPAKVVDLSILKDAAKAN